MHASDDLAVVLRTFVHRGTGNNMLLRMQEKFHLPEPRLTLSRAPSSTADRFSIGSLPTRPGATAGDAARTVGLKAWAHEPLLRVGVSERSVRNFTWAQFLNEYANKWGGAHVDDAVPASLLAIDRYAAGGLMLSTYLLRAGAVAAWEIGTSLVRSAPELLAGGLTANLMAVGVAGGISGPPRDRSAEGELQWLDHDSRGIDLLWYVDGNEPSSSIRLLAGGMPYTVTYTPGTAPPQASVPAVFSGPRELNEAWPDGPPAAGAPISLNGRVLTHQQVATSGAEN